MDLNPIDLRVAEVRGDVLETTLRLERPLARLTAVLPPGEAGRAEAVVDGRRWDAKHYWQPKPGVMEYEFDAPLPPGPVLVRIPFTRR